MDKVDVNDRSMNKFSNALNSIDDSIKKNINSVLSHYTILWNFGDGTLSDKGNKIGLYYGVGNTYIEIDKNIFDKDGLEFINFLFKLNNELKKYGLHNYHDISISNVGLDNGNFKVFDLSTIKGGSKIKKTLKLKENDNIQKQNIIYLNDGQIRYYNSVWKNMYEKYTNNKFYKSIIKQLNEKRYLTRKQKYYLDYLFKYGQSPYEGDPLLIEEQNNNITYSIPEISWLYFLCFLYGGKMKISDWEKDNRVGVNYQDTMLKFLNDNIIKSDKEHYYCTDKGKQIVLDTFYHKDIKDSLNAKHKFKQYDTKKGHEGYTISDIPYYLWEILNKDVHEEFSKLKDLHADYWNSNPHGMGEPKYLEQMLENPYIDSYNYKNLFNHFYPNKIPNIITLYRGIKGEYDISFQKKQFSSWTLNKKEAERFAKYHFVTHAFEKPQESEKQRILKIEIPIEDIDIVIGGYESEVILKNPVKNIEIETIKEDIILYENIIQEQNDNLCFQYTSDEIRYDLIKKELENPDEIWDKYETYSEYDLYETEWLTKVLNKGDYLDYYELFIDKCWSNLYDKEEYENLSKQQAIKKLVNKRFKKIGDSLNLEIEDWSFDEEDEILNIKFYKKNIKENIDSFGSNLVPATGNDSSVEFSHRLLGKTDSFKYDNDNTIDYNIKEENKIINYNDLLKENNIQEFKHGILNARIGDLPGNIPLKISKKLGFKQAKYLNSGHWGNVYDIGLTYKLMKLTMDKNEAKTSFKLTGKNLNNVVKFYDVYQIDLSKYSSENLYVIIMDRVDFDKEENQNIDNELDNVIQTYYYDNPQDSKFEDLNMMIKKLIKNPYLSDYSLDQYVKSLDRKYKNGIYEYYQFIMSLARELKEYGITYGDIRGENFGRKNGKLVSFDMGISTGGISPKEKIKIDEQHDNKLNDPNYNISEDKRAEALIYSILEKTDLEVGFINISKVSEGISGLRQYTIYNKYIFLVGTEWELNSVYPEVYIKQFLFNERNGYWILDTSRNKIKKQNETINYNDIQKEQLVVV